MTINIRYSRWGCLLDRVEFEGFFRVLFRLDENPAQTRSEPHRNAEQAFIVAFLREEASLCARRYCS